ncbi:MAG: hypothetical protein GX634_02410 [Lentisphaerae bacterium]|nr:hypothetical protein [Lentisphaerota bacterium]HQN80530.1 hypothetical protein [Kiritimatiellia bacterium]
MKLRCIGWALAMGVVWSAVCAVGQSPGGIRPSPALNPAGRPAAPAPQPGGRPPPSAQAAPLTLAPAPAVEAEEEEGIYWIWGQKWPGIALGPKIGTTGIGLDLTFGINRYLNLRGGFNYGSFTWSPKLDDVEYDLDVDMLSIPLMLDIHPFGGHFRITAGLFLQPGTEGDLRATPDKNVQIGSHTYPPEVVGTLRGQIDVADTLAPYLGIGFGNAVAEDQLLTFMVELGVIFQSYDSSLTADGAGMTAKLDTFRQDIQEEERNLQKDLDDLKVYPVLTLGLAWHF